MTEKIGLLKMGLLTRRNRMDERSREKKERKKESYPIGSGYGALDEPDRPGLEGRPPIEPCAPLEKPGQVSPRVQAAEGGGGGGEDGGGWGARLMGGGLGFVVLPSTTWVNKPLCLL